jgi:alpha-L-fucosidase 2
MEAAAFDWRDATPLGNGTLGALHFGGLAHDRILFNHERYYAGAITQPLPDISDSLPEVRRLLDEGDFTKANDLYRHRWSAWGYETDSSHYLPGQVLNWRQVIPGAFRSYRRGVDFASGVSTIDWLLEGQTFRRTGFTSMADGCFVFQPCEKGTPPEEALIWFCPQDLAESIDHHNQHLQLHIHHTAIP